MDIYSIVHVYVAILTRLYRWDLRKYFNFENNQRSSDIFVMEEPAKNVDGIPT